MAILLSILPSFLSVDCVKFRSRSLARNLRFRKLVLPASQSRPKFPQIPKTRPDFPRFTSLASSNFTGFVLYFAEAIVLKQRSHTVGCKIPSLDHLHHASTIEHSSSRNRVSRRSYITEPISNTQTRHTQCRTHYREVASCRFRSTTCPHIGAACGIPLIYQIRGEMKNTTLKPGRSCELQPLPLRAPSSIVR